MIRFLLVLTPLLGAFASQDGVSESRLKAVYIYTFGKPTSATWPDRAFAKNPGQFVIGILGANPFNGDLQRATTGKKMQNRDVLIKELGPNDDPADCHLLYVTKENANRLPALRNALAGKPVLIMGDSEDFASAGGAVEFFVTDDNRVHFRINPKSAERAGIQIDHKILRMVERAGNLVEEKP